MPVTLRNRIPQIAAQLNPRVDAAIAAASESIADLARERVPVLSGDLAASIHVEESNQSSGYYVVAGDESADYASYVEFGTSDTPAQPFLIPAAEQGRAEVEQIVTAALQGL